MNSLQFIALCTVACIGLFHNLTVGIFFGVVLIIAALFTAKAPEVMQQDKDRPHAPPPQ